jgi:hypothetical protein
MERRVAGEKGPEMKVARGDARFLLVKLREIVPVACTALIAVSVELHRTIFSKHWKPGKTRLF